MFLENATESCECEADGFLSLNANPSGPTHIVIFIGLHERGQTFQMILLYYHACVIIENVNYS